MSKNDLAGADLDKANLPDADLRGANLRGASLREANLRNASLRHANLFKANLCYSNLRDADLTCADLRGANLIGAQLSFATLHGADLSGADLFHANLKGADLSLAKLKDTNLEWTTLSGANLKGADLSGARGLIDPYQWMLDNFERVDEGFIVWKRIGQTDFAAPESWVIEAGYTLREECHSDRAYPCACGVNFATLSWCKSSYRNADLWRCLLDEEGLAKLVVPYNTIGKARTGCLTLLEKV